MQGASSYLMRLHGGLQSCCWCWWGRSPSGHWGGCCPTATPLSSQGGCYHAQHCHSCIYMRTLFLAPSKYEVSVCKPGAICLEMSVVSFTGCSKHSCPDVHQLQTQVAKQHEGCFLWEPDPLPSSFPQGGHTQDLPIRQADADMAPKVSCQVKGNGSV